MLLEAAIYNEISTDAGVVAIASTRIYPTFIPADASLPAVAYQVFMYPGPLAHDATEGLKSARVQFTCTATTYLVAKNLARAIKALLHGIKRTFGGSGGVTVEYSEVVSLLDGYDFDTEKHTVRVDVMFLYKE